MQRSPEQSHLPPTNLPPNNEKGFPEIPITGEELLGIFNSTQFKSGINTLAGRARKTSYDTEGGFTIFRSLTSGQTKLVYMRDVSGHSTGMSQEEAKRHDQLYRKGNFPLIALHFHPLGGSRQILAYTPSGSDLDNLTDIRGFTRFTLKYDSYPLGVIAIVKGKEDIDLVLFQETGKNLASEGPLRFYDLDALTNQILGDIIDLLRNYGFKAVIVPYTQKGAFASHSAETAEKIKAFAFNLTHFDVPPIT